MTIERRRATAVPAGNIASPCTSVCTIDQASGFCAGCYRTLDEIALWSAFSDDAKRAVLAVLPARRARAGPPGDDDLR